MWSEPHMCRDKWQVLHLVCAWKMRFEAIMRIHADDLSASEPDMTYAMRIRQHCWSLHEFTVLHFVCISRDGIFCSSSVEHQHDFILRETLTCTGGGARQLSKWLLCATRRWASRPRVRRRRKSSSDPTIFSDASHDWDWNSSTFSSADDQVRPLIRNSWVLCIETSFPAHLRSLVELILEVTLFFHCVLADFHLTVRRHWAIFMHVVQQKLQGWSVQPEACCCTFFVDKSSVCKSGIMPQDRSRLRMQGLDEKTLVFTEYTGIRAEQECDSK